MEIALAKWQPKGKKDRTRSAGGWVCPKCGQRLATAVLGFQPPTQICGLISPLIVLVLPHDIDRDGDTEEQIWSSPLQFGAGGHFKKTRRHASRLERGSLEKKVLSRHLRSIENEDDKDYMEITDSPEEGIKALREELKEIARQRKPSAPLHLVNEQLPATFECARPGCNKVSRIEILAPPSVFARIEKMRVLSEPIVEGKSLFGNFLYDQKIARDVFFD